MAHTPQHVLDSAHQREQIRQYGKEPYKKELPIHRSEIIRHRGGIGDPHQSYSDDTTHMAISRNEIVEIYHIPTKTFILFKAFITEFKDNYTTDYHKETVFGRMDPITTFKSVQRSINIGFTVPSVSLEEARWNLQNMNRLISRLYPVYDRDSATPIRGGASTIRSGPLFKIKFGNLIGEASANTSTSVGTAQLLGLPGVIGGISYDPILEEGTFDEVVDGVHTGNFYPQSIRVSFEFSVLHDNKLGWDDTGQWRNQGAVPAPGAGSDGTPNFPYGIGEPVTQWDPRSAAAPQIRGESLPPLARNPMYRLNPDATNQSWSYDGWDKDKKVYTQQVTSFKRLTDRERYEQMINDAVDNPGTTAEELAYLIKVRDQVPKNDIRSGMDARKEAMKYAIWGDTWQERLHNRLNLKTDLLRTRMEIRTRDLLGPTLGGMATQWGEDHIDQGVIHDNIGDLVPY
jgi:hypothetical protein